MTTAAGHVEEVLHCELSAGLRLYELTLSTEMPRLTE